MVPTKGYTQKAFTLLLVNYS